MPNKTLKIDAQGPAGFYISIPGFLNCLAIGWLDDFPVIAPEAHQDVEEAYSWYEDRRRGLGEESLDCVDACIQKICRMPELYEKIHGEYHRALVRRFPYVIFYEYGGGKVTIYSIFHGSRDPEKWRNRLD